MSALIGLPLAVGVALAEGLQEHGARLLLKWPNDLYVLAGAMPAKVGGILTEVKALGPPASSAGAPDLHRVVVGFGLNLFAVPEGLTQPAAAIFSPMQQEALDRAALARALAALTPARDQIDLVAISAQTAEAAGTGWRSVSWPSHPDADAMLAQAAPLCRAA